MQAWKRQFATSMQPEEQKPIRFHRTMMRMQDVTPAEGCVSG